MAYDAEATRRRIFAAANDEFAQYGLAGARVDRIAKAAAANKQAIYLYYGGKEKLFGVVVQARVDELCHAVPLDPKDPAGSVSALFDWYADHPDVVRLLLWEGLEYDNRQVEGEEERAAMYRENVRDLLAAGLHTDGDGHAGTRIVQDWMYTVIGLVAWNFSTPQLRRLILDEPDPDKALRRRRAAVVELVSRLA